MRYLLSILFFLILMSCANKKPVQLTSVQIDKRLFDCFKVSPKEGVKQEIYRNEQGSRKVLFNYNLSDFINPDLEKCNTIKIISFLDLESDFGSVIMGSKVYKQHLLHLKAVVDFQVGGKVIKTQKYRITEAGEPLVDVFWSVEIKKELKKLYLKLQQQVEKDTPK